MIDPQAKPKTYLRLMVLVALLGMVSALVTFVFVVLVNESIALIWEQAANMVGLDPRLFTLLACSLDAFAAGALLVMLTDSMIPESFEHGGKETGLALVLGVSVAVAVSLMQLG
jgi:zinc transporter ZupT